MEGEGRRSDMTTRRSQPYFTAYAAAAQSHPKERKGEKVNEMASERMIR
jgi:hypothetical protein